MPAPTYPDTISGKYLVAVIGSVTIDCVQDWEANETADQLDGTTGADLGYENDDDGISRVEVAFNLVQNLANGPAVTVGRGTTMALKLYRSAGDALPAFDIPAFKVFGARTRGAVRERFTQAITGRSKGAYTHNAPGA